MIRVLQVYKDYFPVYGGIENHLRLLCQRLHHSGEVSIRVLVTNLGPQTVVDTADGYPVVKAGRLVTVASTPLSVLLFWEMARSVADIAHLHFPYPLGELAHLLVGRSPRLVITYHSDIVRQQRLLALYRPFLRRVLAKADRIIVTSPHYRDSSPHLLPFRDKCIVIPSCVDLARYDAVTPEQIAQVKGRYPAPRILFVGRFRYYKGLPYLIEAMPKVPGTLLLIGSGPLEQALRQQVQRLGLEQRVIFVGQVSEEELPIYYRASDLFVLPSCERAEALGLSMIEAMACGLPAVCTELGTGTTYVNRHEETGLVVPPRNVAALAHAMGRLLGDKALRQQMGQRARARVAEEFTAEYMVARILEIYRSLVGVSP